MPYTIKWEKREAYCKFTGEVSGQEIIDCNMDMYGSASFDTLKICIFDMLDVAKVNMTIDEVKKTSAFDRASAKFNPRIKVAIVSTDKVFQELSKGYLDGMSISPWKGKAFHTLDEAIEWASQPYTYS